MNLFLSYNEIVNDNITLYLEKDRTNQQTRNFYATFKVKTGSRFYPYFIIKHNCKGRTNDIFQVFKLNYINDCDKHYISGSNGEFCDPDIFIYQEVLFDLWFGEDQNILFPDDARMKEIAAGKIIGQTYIFLI